MKVNRKVVGIAAAITALSAGGVGIAQAVGGGSEEQVSGPDAERAKAAALKAVGGGTVIEVERNDENTAGGFEVEVRRADGSQVEVRIDDRYQAVGKTADDDTGSESHDDAG